MIFTLSVFFLTDLHIVTGGVEFDPLNDTCSALVITRLDHTIHSWVLEGLG